MYQRTEDLKSYQRITTIDDKGNYRQYTKWGDGMETNIICSNIFEMGWRSIKEFLKNRKGFKKVG